MPARIPPSADRLRDLEVLVRAHHALLLVETTEEDRVHVLLEHLADRLGVPLLVWQPGRGLRRAGADDAPAVHGSETPAQCLAFIEGADNESIYYLRDFAPFLGEPEVASRLKDVHRKYVRHAGAVVMVGAEVELAADLEPLFTPFELGPPDRDAYYRFLSMLLRDIRQRRPVQVDVTSEDVAELLRHLEGLTLMEARKVLTQAIVEDGRLSRDDIARVLDAKRRIIERSGVLEYFPAEEPMGEVAGLARLKDWLRKRRAAFLEPERARQFGLSPPKGLLLLGVQGCGKSLCAKAVAREWGMPLVRLDPARLYQKYFGETERNFRRATRTAEAMAPVVLWLDEIEKAFATGDDRDSGTSRRVFGSFLTWLQEKRSDVFVIATGNDVSQLPPELLRKGRFDEIFFLDLPTEEVRREILEVHLRRRDRDPAGFDLGALAAASDGFSGAELEQAVVSALYTAFSKDTDLTTELVLDEIRGTVPLSVTMAEKVEALRRWARTRAVPADGAASTVA
ncbi:MAG: AAA family ATPase [Myxococcota bacterium]